MDTTDDIAEETCFQAVEDDCRLLDNLLHREVGPRFMEDIERKRVLAQRVLDGKYDDLPEQCFQMVGGIEEEMLFDCLSQRESLSQSHFGDTAASTVVQSVLG
ncbi:hypothetical protein OPV22_009173 [Ensete ventricosum]|uniref:Uncharacterized protein n=1 Tax=Ensete ventricosum TaxID=4639 RepID=A0AAV8REE6_ENSVE|nr:hypothetical protein OPV22_009173 [Ensete ventricosum]